MTAWLRVQCTSYTKDLEVYSGYQSPIRITFTKDGDHYKVKEFLYPLDGSEYEPSIHKAFPSNLVSRAMESEMYDKEKEQADINAAKAYFAGKQK